MKVTVHYAAQARAAAGTPSESVELDEASATVRALILLLAERHDGPLRPMLVGKDGGPQPSLLVIVGDEQVRATDGRGLRPGDSVCIMTPISGG